MDNDYPGDFGTKISDHETTMPKKSVGDYRLCPLKFATGLMGWKLCDGISCSWYDSRAECCAVLTLARSAHKK